MQAINNPKHPGFQGYSLDEQEMTLHVQNIDASCFKIGHERLGIVLPIGYRDADL